MKDLSFIFPIVIKILSIYVVFKKRFKRILKNKGSSGVRENLELRLRAPAPAPGPCCKAILVLPWYGCVKYIFIWEGLGRGSNFRQGELSSQKYKYDLWQRVGYNCNVKRCFLSMEIVYLEDVSLLRFYTWMITRLLTAQI